VIGRWIAWSELIASGADDAVAPVAEWRAVQPGLCGAARIPRCSQGSAVQPGLCGAARALGETRC
jgi:hypothetical protein